MPHEVGQRVEALFRKRLRGGWGMTETASAGSRIPITVEPRAGLIGTPLPNIELRIVGLHDPATVLGPEPGGGRSPFADRTSFPGTGSSRS
ncbi:MAG: AMP-binding protein [Rhodospirillales bacterium]